MMQNLDQVRQHGLKKYESHHRRRKNVSPIRNQRIKARYRVEAKRHCCQKPTIRIWQIEILKYPLTDTGMFICRPPPCDLEYSHIFQASHIELTDATAVVRSSHETVVSTHLHYGVCSSHETDVSTHLHPAQPLSVPMPPGETRQINILQLQQGDLEM